ncbi:MAG: hypothetical protein IJS65_09185, partial [Clostridia bacterium]|nr:hypothetical protein [Clostridia bacterium]
MKKIILILLSAALALLLCACAGTRTALTVGKNRIDEAEYAFYLNYNRYVNGADAEPDMKAVREEAVKQIVRNEIVRIKCREMGLTLTGEQKSKLKED